MSCRSLKYVAYALSAAAVLACGPSSYTMSVDERSASTSGCDFSGKSIAIAYVTGADVTDSLFNAGFAEGLASGLEQSYYDSQTVIPLFTLPDSPQARYGARDTLVNLVMDLDADVVLLIDKPRFSHAQTVSSDAGVRRAAVPFMVNLHLYDAMDKEDTVKNFSSSSKYLVDIVSDGSESVENFDYKALEAAAGLSVEGGRALAANFVPQWDRKSYTFYYYPSGDWTDACTKLMDCRFKDAMDRFLTLVDRGSSDRRASAAYDLALCCFLLKEYDTALSWLDYADKCYSLNLSPWLRKRCTESPGRD